VTASVAGAELFTHYARVFGTGQDQSLSIRGARERSPGLFHLHMAFKDCYARILKHHARGRRRTELRSARCLNALIRLGKVIHYHASDNAPDRTMGPLRNWPNDLSGSFWTSDGQAVIKRNEAFVRVCRHVLALASRTLKDWCDPKGLLEDDILLSRGIQLAVRNLFIGQNYSGKVELLFGNRADLFKRPGDDSFQRSVLKLALEGVAALRHGAFHFKGLGTFADALTASGIKTDTKVLSAIRQLWDTDAGERVGQLLKTMRGADFKYFLEGTQNRQLLSALTNADSAPLPLPRFRKMLRRAENAWSEGKDDIRLPGPPNRIELERPIPLCQYTALTLLYERPFRSWLHGCTAPVLNGLIHRAVERATAAARDLNAGDDADRREIIVAKAAHLDRLADDGDVEAFFFNLPSGAPIKSKS
jgi:hypothetical protein